MIIPSIDLMKGKAVQLKQGKEKLLEIEKPLELAHKFSQFGPLAVIDLDAALETGTNEELIGKICQVADCRVGGGIRNLDKAQRILELGAEKIIIGTGAWKERRLNQDFLKALRETLGREKIILALDCFGEQVLIKGWRESTGINVFSLLEEASEFASEFLITCVEKEGCLQGTDLAFYKKIREVCHFPVTAAGGITTVEEILALTQMNIDVQLGLAIYTGKLKLEEAFVASLNWNRGIFGLLPSVVVDEVGRLLMLAWVSPESLKMTFESGRATYFSRSRQALWIKGESSGKYQNWLKARVDCDGDTVLLVVSQVATGACHKGNYSCFGGQDFRLEDLYSVIKDRLTHPVANSYTASLNDKTVREKILEEASELTEARNRDEIVWETADLLYFITVLLAREQIDIHEIFNELKRRRRKARANRQASS